MKLRIKFDLHNFYEGEVVVYTTKVLHIETSYKTQLYVTVPAVLLRLKSGILELVELQNPDHPVGIFEIP